jgi:pre-rRNA-processing protein TSR1
MAPISAPTHHHRSTTKLNKKNFKSRHASKGALKELSKGVFDNFAGYFA